jgi:hypothetical protein
MHGQQNIKCHNSIALVIDKKDKKHRNYTDRGKPKIECGGVNLGLKRNRVIG